MTASTRCYNRQSRSSPVVIMLTTIAMTTMMLQVSQAQVVISDPYLDLNMCRLALQTCDTADGNGGIGRANGEYYCFIRTLGEERKCNPGNGAITGRQDLTFIDLVCNEIPGVACRLNSEFPIDVLTTDAPDNNALLANICTQVDQTIEPRPCPTPTTPNPVESQPTRSPSTPTLRPTGTEPPIAANFTLDDCIADLATASVADIQNDPNGETLDYGEYVEFLNLVGSRTCFIPTDNFPTATNATFNQHRCLSRFPCAGSSTIDMTALNLRDFCERSFNFALSSPRCDTGPTAMPQPQPTPSPVTAQPVPSPTTPAPQPAPTAVPTEDSTSTPTVTAAPTASVAPTGFNITTRGASSGAAHLNMGTKTTWMASCLVLALLLSGA
mmetsp:Transcript_30061/g.82553  ORF Transcript_30061/g.82553 Transcript_30061/m.82553 type:complete len:384 (+) Transcript_30061:203-1354(+)